MVVIHSCKMVGMHVFKPCYASMYFSIDKPLWLNTSLQHITVYLVLIINTLSLSSYFPLLILFSIYLVLGYSVIFFYYFSIFILFFNSIVFSIMALTIITIVPNSSITDYLFIKGCPLTHELSKCRLEFC